MRGTLHLVALDDLIWMLAALGPVFISASQRRHEQLGLDARLKSKSVAAIRRILAEHGALTRYEIVDRLRRYGIKLDPKTQAPIHLLAFAALNGVLCLGPNRDNGEPTYVLIDDWIGKQRPTPAEDGLRELANRYFAAYGPASVDDLSAWSGLPVAQARAAVTDALGSLDQITFQARPHFLPKGRLRTWRPTASSRPSVRLLPAFDTYLLGYHQRDPAVPAVLKRRLQRGGGWLHPAVVVNGRVVGAWSLRRSGQPGKVVVETPRPFPGDVRKALEAEVDDIGHFLGRTLTTAIGPLAVSRE